MKYQLELSESQLRTLAKALEVYSRLGLGQIESALRTALEGIKFDDGLKFNDIYKDEFRFNLFQSLSSKFHALVFKFQHPNMYFGITQSNVSESHKMARDIEWACRNILTHDRMSVYYGDPTTAFKVSKAGIPKIKKTR